MTVVWSVRAVRNLALLRARMARDRPDAARQMAEAILASVDLLSAHPGLGKPGRIRGTRELVVPGTPYLVPYRVRGERIEIAAVFHGRQKWPRSW